MKKHLILVINPRSSGFELIREKILPFLEDAHFEKNQLTTFEIQPTSPMENAQEMAKGLKDGDIILVAGGDGTAHIAANAAALSGKKNLKIKFTGFGNFNDYAHSFSKNSGKAAIEAFEKLEVKAKIRPIELKINGSFFRYAPLYATIGLTAEMAEIFEGRRIRKVLKKIHNRNMRLILSLSAATRFYFKHCRNHVLNISEIKADTNTFYKIPPNPTELIARHSLNTVFEQLRQEYDYVIVDTAPVGLVTDTLQIGRIVDATVYMCRADYTLKSSFDMINELSAEKKLPKMNIVF